MKEKTQKINCRVLNFIVFIFVVFLAVFINVRHEIWRDEAQAFLITRDCQNLSDFLYVMHHEGTPYLWHIILLPFAKLGFSIVTEKAITLIFSIASMYLVIYKSSFNYVHKILIILGYYFLYEYTAISRSYCLSLFFILLLAQLYKYRFEKSKLYLLIIFIFCNSNIHSTIIGFFIFLSFIYELIKIGKLTEKKYELIICTFGFILIFLEVLPSKDLMNSLKLINCDSLFSGYKTAAISVLAAFFPVPDFNMHFWNSVYLYNFVTYYYGFIAYVLVLRLFYRNRNIFIIFILSTLSLIAFFVLKGIPGVRHTGIIYLCFLFCLWIIIEKKQCKDNLSKIIIYILLIVQVFSTVIAVNFDIKYNFSNAKYAADFIESNTYISDTVIMYPSEYGSSIIANFKYRKKLYYIQNNGTGSYTVWNQRYEDVKEAGQGKMFEKLQDYMIINNRPVVYLILNQRLIAGNKNYKSTLLYQTENSIIDEDFYIYKIQFDKASP